MGKVGERVDFEWVYDEQPHTWRRKEILGRSTFLGGEKTSLGISDSVFVIFLLKWQGVISRAGVSDLTP